LTEYSPFSYIQYTKTPSIIVTYLFTLPIRELKKRVKLGESYLFPIDGMVSIQYGGGAWKFWTVIAQVNKIVTSWN